jgi:ribosome recycling factor
MSATERLEACLREADDEMCALVSKTKVELAKVPPLREPVALLHGLSVASNGNSTPTDQATTVALFADQSAREVTERDPDLITKIRELLENTEIAAYQRSGGLRIDLRVEPVDEDQQRQSLYKMRTEIKTGQREIRAVKKNNDDTLTELLADGLPQGEVFSARQSLRQSMHNHVEELDEVLRGLLRLAYSGLENHGV